VSKIWSLCEAEISLTELVKYSRIKRKMIESKSTKHQERLRNTSAQQPLLHKTSHEAKCDNVISSIIGLFYDRIEIKVLEYFHRTDVRSFWSR
jgi:hypothetical protein